MRLKFKWIFTLLVALIMQFSYAQEKTITGKVTDASGPLPGVNIIIKGTKVGTSTNFDGTYSIKTKVGETLVFSFLGMRELSIIVGQSNSINPRMSSGVEQIGEVVIAYGKQNKKRLIQSVSTVNSDKFKDVPVASVQDILQGQTSGVQVINSSGILGSAPVVKVRGVASITAGGRPLYVVDGIPMSDAILTAGQGGQALNTLTDINFNDVESLSVLKDAAATAVYGSRGSNGVVLITTKSGKKGQPARVQLNIGSSWTSATDLLNMMNANEYRDYLLKIKAITDPTNPAQVGQDSYDWVDGVSRVGLSKNLDFSLSGGTEKNTYFVGANHSEQDGFIIGNGLRRNGARINMTSDAKDWFKVGLNIGLTETKNDRIASDNNTLAPFTSAFLTVPTVTPYGPDGNFVNLGFVRNVIAIENLDINNSDTFRVIGDMYGEFKLSNDLVFKSDFGIDRSKLEEFTRSFNINSPGGTASDYWAEQNRYVFTNTLNFTKTYAQKYNFNILGGVTLENTSIRDITVAGNGFASDNLINVESAVTKTTTTNTVVENRLVGLFSRLNFSYDNKYIFEGSIRRDGSSRFGETKYGTFWSGGVAWAISEENFLRGNSTISNFKLKANYGVAGNDRIGSYDALENYVPGTLSNYNDSPGYILTRYPNKNLKWERSTSYDLGIELGFLNDRVKLSVDYYNKKTNDLLLNRSFNVAENLGVNFIIENIGSMENKGFDIDLNTTNIKSSSFEWTTNFNIGLNKNIVLDLGPDASTDRDGNKFIIGTASQRAIVGNSVNTFFLIRYAGVNPTTGNAEWLDFNGNPTTTPTANDRVIVGDANPDFTGGFTNNIKYKNFDLSSLINFSYGNDIMVDGLRFTENPSGTSGFNKSTKLLNVWQAPGDIAYVPRVPTPGVTPSTSPTFATFNQRSTLQLKDGSFARLKNITVGYTLPLDKIAKARFVTGARIYFTASNLYTLKNDELAGIDPEVTDSQLNTRQGETFFTPPQSKTFLIGTRLTF
jgi:TonB-dependent starch-binding outer membrane protein SusC